MVLSGYSSNVQVFAAAYVYAFPLVIMDATETSATNTEEAIRRFLKEASGL